MKCLYGIEIKIILILDLFMFNTYDAAHWKGLRLWTVSDIDENIQKMVKKKWIFCPFSIVKFECFD